MKACPTCNRTFEDTFTFCLIDGSVLSAPYDPDATRQVPSSPKPDPPATEIINIPPAHVEPRAPLQSTIRVPVPQVPDLSAPKTVAMHSDRTIGVPLMFRLPLAARGILAVLVIIPWVSLSGWGRGWNLYYPLVAGALTITAGIVLSIKFKTGRLLIVEGIVAEIVGIVILLSDFSWWYWHGAWPIVSGVLLIAAAIELRRYFMRTWVLGLAGGIFTIYTILKVVAFRQHSFDFFIALMYVEVAAVFAYGVILTVYSFVTRPKDFSD